MFVPQTHLKAGRIASWYNGVRVPCEEVDNRPDWSLNDNVINLDEDTAIDVPPQWSSTGAYAASLGMFWVYPLRLFSYDG